MLKTNPATDWWKYLGKGVPLEKISQSSASQIQTCGLAWRLNHIEHLGLVKPPVYFPLGTAFHKGMKQFWLAGQPSTFKKSWGVFRHTPIAYKEGESWLQWSVRGQAMAKALEDALRGTYRIRGTRVELYDEVKLPSVKLVRYVDVLTIAKKMPILVDASIKKVDGPITIDMKTAGQRYTPDSVLQSQQLMTYAIPSEKVDWSNLSAYAVVTKAVTPQVQLIGHKYDKKEVVGQIVRLQRAADRVRAGDFVQIKGDHCGYCDFKKLCYPNPDSLKAYRVRRDRPRTGSAHVGSPTSNTEGAV